ncbi:MAG TPA: hypothetical protein VMZ26_02085 [Pyrinomonadaceae bacterium]|nr:hypothetical protein [Pyrinomonadaceae bacterium]
MQDSRSDKRFSIDTTFVLFFLAIDFGQSAFSAGIDTIFSGLTLGMLLVLPYFLPSATEKPDFMGWVLGRSLITVFAAGLGLMYQQALGVLLPDAFRFLPMTLLVVTAMLSCYLQFYAMIRFRLAR